MPRLERELLRGVRSPCPLAGIFQVGLQVSRLEQYAAAVVSVLVAPLAVAIPRAWFLFAQLPQARCIAARSVSTQNFWQYAR